MKTEETELLRMALPSYLYHELKVSYTDPESSHLNYDNCILSWPMIAAIIENPKYKIRFRPWKALTEYQEDLGFVPIDFFEIGDEDNDSREYDHGNIKLIEWLETISEHSLGAECFSLPSGVFLQLIEWHFNVYNLPDRLVSYKE